MVIPISPQELRDAEERAFRRLVKKTKLPGFRPGKAPRKVFEQAYGAETIAAQAMEDVVPQVYAKAVREHDLDPVDRPKMEVLPDEGDQPIRVKAVVDVRPDFELHAYKGTALARAPVAVTDADVDNALAALARERATLVPVEREARLDDVVTVDYEGKIDGEAFEGGAATGQQIELSEDRFVPGFASGIAGMAVGQTKDVQATFPTDYTAKELAGKAAVFTVTLHEVKEREIPPIDDELAKIASTHETLEELKADVRARLRRVAESRRRREIGDELVERLVAEHDFPLPPSMVDREAESMLQDMSGVAARRGASLQQYLKDTGSSEDELLREYRPQAERRVKATLLLERIAKAENIRATPADIQNEMQTLAAQYGQPVERIRQALGNNVVSLMDGIIRNKTVEFLVQNAVVAEMPAEPGSAP